MERREFCEALDYKENLFESLALARAEIYLQNMSRSLCRKVAAPEEGQRAGA